MSGSSWIYQGRQYHQWFGHGTKPRDGESGTGVPGSIEERIRSLGMTVIAGLPPSRRHHAAARFDAIETEKLVATMLAWVRSSGLSEASFAERLLGLSQGHPAVAAFREAAERVASANTAADMRAASDALASGMQAVGLDGWKRYLTGTHDRARTAGWISGVQSTHSVAGSGPANSPIPPADGKAAPFIYAPAPTSDAADTAAARGILADRLLKAGKAATAEDIAAVRKHIIENVTVDALRLMIKSGTMIVVTRDAVQNHMPEIGSPRGYSEAADKKAAGVFVPQKNEIIIATKTGENGDRILSREHGSAGLVAHEAGHSIDVNLSKPGLSSNSAEFISVYNQEGNSGVFSQPYFHQVDPSAGRQEAWAEGFARFVDNPDRMAREYPKMYEYFKVFVARQLGKDGK